MALLDVTDVLLDPDFATTFTVTRRRESVTNGGMGVVAPTSFPNIIGVVTPATTRELSLLPEGTNLTGAIRVATMFRLSSGDGVNQYAADIVTWKGNAYTVANVNDNSQFGAGFVRAICTLRPVNPL